MRKIIGYFSGTLLLTYAIFWFAGAYFLQKQAANYIDSYKEDSFRIEYKDISVEGFPFRWVVRIMEPSIYTKESLSDIAAATGLPVEDNAKIPSYAKGTNIHKNNGVKEYKISAKIAQINLNLDLSRISFLVDRNIDIRDLANSNLHYSLKANYTPNFTIILKDSPIFFSTNMEYRLDYYFKEVLFPTNGARIYNASTESQIAELNDVSFSLERHYFKASDISHIDFNAKYSGDVEVLSYNELNIASKFALTQEVYSYNMEKQLNQRRASRITIDKLKAVFEGKDMLLARGDVISYFGKIEPVGKVNVFLGNYPELINNLLPAKFLPPSEVTKIVNATNLLKQVDEYSDNRVILSRLKDLAYYSGEKINISSLSPSKDSYFEINFDTNGVNLSGKKLEELTHSLEEDNN